jgi:hypothetical protein
LSAAGSRELRLAGLLNRKLGHEAPAASTSL